MNYWIFQSGKVRYDLSKHLVPRAETEWYVRQDRKSMCPADVVYFWQVEADPPLLMWGTLIGPPFRDGKDFKVRVRYEVVFDAPPPLSVFAMDPRLADLPVFQTRQGTNYRISVAQAAALSKHLGPLAPVVTEQDETAGMVAAHNVPKSFTEATLLLLWTSPHRRIWLVGVILPMVLFVAWNSLPESEKTSLLRKIPLSNIMDQSTAEVTCKKYGVTIERAREEVEPTNTVLVSGSVESLPPDSELWVVAAGKADSPDYWPREKADVQGQTWSKQIQHRLKSLEDRKRFAISIVGRDGQKLISSYLSAMEKAAPDREWPPLMETTHDMAVCDGFHEVVLK